MDNNFNNQLNASPLNIWNSQKQTKGVKDNLNKFVLLYGSTRRSRESAKDLIKYINTNSEACVKIGTDSDGGLFFATKMTYTEIYRIVDHYDSDYIVVDITSIASVEVPARLDTKFHNELLKVCKL